MNSTGYIYGARADASSARMEARPDSDSGGPVALLQPAVVKVVQAAGVYQVATLGDDGEENALIDGVRTFPITELAVDALVWLVRWPGNPMPVIMVAGGGGSNCAVSVNMFGVLWG